MSETRKRSMTIVEFLTARLDEYERLARAVDLTPDLRGSYQRQMPNGLYERYTPEAAQFYVMRVRTTGEDGMPKHEQDGPATSLLRAMGPDRILADIAAKRAIIELHGGAHDCQEIRTGTYPDDWPEAASWGTPGGEWRHAAGEHFEDEPCPTVRLLASVYSDHLDYNPEWRP